MYLDISVRKWRSEKNEKNNDVITEDGKQITRNGVESRTIYELNHL
jgi:hypothetical protein